MASSAGRQRAAQRERNDLGPYLSVEVDGEHYLLTARDMTALDVRAMREQCGFSYNRLVDLVRGDLDVDLLAAIMWMARRIRGERDLSYAEVAAGVNYGVDWKPVDPAQAGQDVHVGDHDPEA